LGIKKHTYVDHITSITCAKSNGTACIDIWKVLFNVLESFDQVKVRTAAPLIFDPILKVHAIARATCGIRCDYNVALLGEDCRIPSR